MFNRARHKHNVIRNAAIGVIEVLEERRLLAASCVVVISEMQITGDGNANLITIDFSSSLATAKDNGTPMAGCSGRSIGSLTAVMGAGNDLLDASALPSGIP